MQASLRFPSRSSQSNSLTYHSTRIMHLLPTFPFLSSACPFFFTPYFLSLCIRDRHLDGIGPVMGGRTVDHDLSHKWVARITAWDEEALTYHRMAPSKARVITRFRRKVCVERLARHPDLASRYGGILAHVQALEGTMTSGYAAQMSLRYLKELLRDVEAALHQTLAVPGGGSAAYLAGREPSLADLCMVVLLRHIHMLGLSKALLRGRERLRQYWRVMRRRKSYWTAVVLPCSFVSRPLDIQSHMEVRWRLLSGTY